MENRWHTKGSGVAIVIDKVVGQFTRLTMAPMGRLPTFDFPAKRFLIECRIAHNWCAHRRCCLREHGGVTVSTIQLCVSYGVCNCAMLPQKHTNARNTLPKVRFIYYLRLRKSLQLNITFLERWRKHIAEEKTPTPRCD